MLGDRKSASLEKKLNFLVGAVLKKLRKNKSSTAVFLLKSSKMAYLKAKYMKKRPKKVVDVLAFPELIDFPVALGSRGAIGEIYINREIAQSDFERARFLAIHGLLHLLGFSHDKKTDILIMEKEEKKLCSFFGIKTNFFDQDV